MTNLLTISMIRMDLLGVLILATLSICVGLLVNQFRDKPLPLVYQTKSERLQYAVERIASGPAVPRSASVQIPEQLNLDEFRAFVEGKQGVVLDARPEIFHRLGHVPGAVSLPRQDFEANYELVRGLLEMDKSQPLVVYCSGASCEDSKLVQAAMTKLGYSNVGIFTGGWEEWIGAKLPEERKE